MSENTNTPSRDSNKDLYTINSDNGFYYVGFYALVENNPELENNTSAKPGSNTVINSVEIGNIDGVQIDKVGYIGVPLQTRTPEIEKAIRERAEKSRKEREAELEVIDKNHNGIDDRNE